MNMPAVNEMIEMHDLLKRAADHKATDILVVAGAAPTERVNGVLRPVVSGRPLTPEEARMLITHALTPEQLKRFQRDKELDVALTGEDGVRFRMNVHFQKGSMARTTSGPAGVVALWSR